jgi:hypothetical protein
MNATKVINNKNIEYDSGKGYLLPDTSVKTKKIIVLRQIDMDGLLDAFAKPPFDEKLEVGIQMMIDACSQYLAMPKEERRDIRYSGPRIFLLSQYSGGNDPIMDHALNLDPQDAVKRTKEVLEQIMAAPVKLE